MRKLVLLLPLAFAGCASSRVTEPTTQPPVLKQGGYQKGVSLASTHIDIEVPRGWWCNITVANPLEAIPKSGVLSHTQSRMRLGSGTYALLFQWVKDNRLDLSALPRRSGLALSFRGPKATAMITDLRHDFLDLWVSDVRVLEPGLAIAELGAVVGLGNLKEKVPCFQLVFRKKPSLPTCEDVHEMNQAEVQRRRQDLESEGSPVGPEPSRLPSSPTNSPPSQPKQPQPPSKP